MYTTTSKAMIEGDVDSLARFIFENRMVAWEKYRTRVYPLSRHPQELWEWRVETSPDVGKGGHATTEIEACRAAAEVVLNHSLTPKPPAATGTTNRPAAMPGHGP